MVVCVGVTERLSTSCSHRELENFGRGGREEGGGREGWWLVPLFWRRSEREERRAAEQLMAWCFRGSRFPTRDPIWWVGLTDRLYIGMGRRTILQPQFETISLTHFCLCTVYVQRNAACDSIPWYFCLLFHFLAAVILDFSLSTTLWSDFEVFRTEAGLDFINHATCLCSCTTVDMEMPG